ncbi:MAG: c-type cytochrome [Candidatus Tectomicrobia bacterium]|nr:c-type cytochrome [Candidatus Tectomicrobia bacterium]
MRVPMFLQAILAAVVAYLIFRYGIRPPIPSSLLSMYMAVALAAILLYATSDEAFLQDFMRPIWAVLRAETLFTQVTRAIVFVLLPLGVASFVFAKAIPKVEAPAELRVIHPAPPTSIDFKGKPFVLKDYPENPLRKEKEKHIAEGSAIYYQNCHFCHGDNLDGRGMFAQGFNPPPANFVDPGTIAQLQESFLFWRISKGAPGLPNESTPWSSAMPIWENYLTDEEIWKVILFLYEATGSHPRTWE